MLRTLGAGLIATRGVERFIAGTAAGVESGRWCITTMARLTHDDAGTVRMFPPLPDPVHDGPAKL
jgi:hypothetical protein